MSTDKGVKLDQGKLKMSLVLGDFAKALTAVVNVGTYGAEKYTEYGWLEVSSGRERYTDALLRHLFAELQGEDTDTESELLHAAHVAWNSLARLQLILRDLSSNQGFKD